jgi:uncharacterized protein involved in exopolysaccharide biosynthesis
MKTETPISELSEQEEFPPAVPISGNGVKEDDEISLLDFLIVLAERKHIIFGVTAGFAILAAIISLFLGKSYTGTVTLLPPQDNSSMSALSSQMGGLSALLSGGLGMKNPNEMYVAMFESRTVEDAMVQHFGLVQEYDSKYLSDAVK